MTREEFEDLLRGMGAVIVKGVSKKADLMIALENPSPAKVKAAEELGIPIVYLR